MALWNLGLVLAVNASQYRTEMRSAAASTRQLLGTQSELHQQSLKYQRLQARAARDTIRSLTYIGAGIGIMNRFTSKASDADFELRGLASIMKMTGEQAKSFTSGFRESNRELRNFASSTVIGRMRALAQAGYGQNQILENTAAVLRATNASLGNLSVESATELGINLDRAFGSAGQSMSDLLDIAVQGANKFPMTVDQIAVAMGYASEAATSFGQSAESVISAIGMLMPVTKTASKAGVAYRSMLAAMTKPKTISFLEQMGIAMRDANGQFRDAFEILADMDDALERIRKKDLKTGGFEAEVLTQKMFGARGKGALAAYHRLKYNVQATGLNKGRQFADSRAAMFALTAGFGSTTNAAKTLAERMMESSRLIQQSLEASAEEFQVALGSALTPLTNTLKQRFAELLDAFTGMVKEGSNNDVGRGLLQGVGYASVIAAFPLALKLFHGFLALAHVGGSMRGLVRQAEDQAGRKIVRPPTPAFGPAAMPGTWAYRKQKWMARLGLGQFAPVFSAGQDRTGAGNLGRENPLTRRERLANWWQARRTGAPNDALFRSNFSGKLGNLAGAVANSSVAVLGMVSAFQMASGAIQDAARELTESIDEKMEKFLGQTASLKQLIDPMLNLLKGKKLTLEDVRSLNAKGLLSSYGQMVEGIRSGKGVEATFKELTDLRNYETLRKFGVASEWELKQQAEDPNKKYMLDQYREQKKINEATMQAVRDAMVQVPLGTKGLYAGDLTYEEQLKQLLTKSTYYNNPNDVNYTGTRQDESWDRHTSLRQQAAYHYLASMREYASVGPEGRDASYSQLYTAREAYMAAVRADLGWLQGTKELFSQGSQKLAEQDASNGGVTPLYKAPINIQGAGWSPDRASIPKMVRSFDAVTAAIDRLGAVMRSGQADGVTVTPPGLAEQR